MKVDGKALTEILTVLSVQNRTLTVQPEDKGWRVVTRSPDGISLTSAETDAGMFDGYVRGGRFALDTEEWLKALRACGNDVDMTQDAGIMVLEGNGYRFRIPMIDPEETTVRIPEVTYKGTCMMPMSLIRAFTSVLDMKNMIGMTLRMSADGLTLSSATDTGKEVVKEISADDDIVITCPEEQVAQYPSVSVMEFVRSLPPDMIAELSFSTDSVLRVSFGDDKYSGIWMLAPWIEE